MVSLLAGGSADPLSGWLDAARAIGGLGGSAVLVLVLLGFFTDRLATGSRVRGLEAALAARDEFYQKQLDVKDQQIERVRESRDQLQAGMLDKAVPAIARSALILERLAPLVSTDVSVRRTE